MKRSLQTKIVEVAKENNGKFLGGTRDTERMKLQLLKFQLLMVLQINLTLLI